MPRHLPAKSGQTELTQLADEGFSLIDGFHQRLVNEPTPQAVAVIHREQQLHKSWLEKAETASNDQSARTTDPATDAALARLREAMTHIKLLQRLDGQNLLRGLSQLNLPQGGTR